MGSPIARLIAEWKLCIIETMVFEKLGDSLHTRLCYINEVFAIVNVEDNQSKYFK